MARIHFSDFEDRSSLQHYNAMNSIVLHLLRRERICFHQVCVFTYNILVLVLDSSGEELSYIKTKNGFIFDPIQKNRYYFIPAGCVAEYHLQPDISYYTIHVGFELFSGLDFYNGSQECLEGNAVEMIQKMKDLWNDTDSLHQACRVRELLLGFFLQHWPERNRTLEQVPKEFTDLLGYVNDHCDAKISVRELANRMFLNVDTFSRKFKHFFELSPKEYLTRLIVQKSQRLLLASQWNIHEISDHLNFNNEYYFSRFFKKNIGISPQSYRNKFMVKPPSKKS